MSLALRAFRSESWLCAYEQAPAQILTSSLVATQPSHHSRQKHRFAEKKFYYTVVTLKRVFVYVFVGLCFSGSENRGICFLLVVLS